MGDYAASGVDEEREQAAFSAVMRPWLEKTRVLRPDVRVTSGIGSGHFASVLALAGAPSIAVTTDGVGTKIEIARLAGRYEGIGIDCVANNVNDLICVGADPVALVDYIALDAVDERVLGELARGLFLGADAAGVAIVGGEIAQVASLLAARGAAGDAPVFDLVGTAVGVLAAGAAVLDGSAVGPGDVVVGLRSSGLHSNGYSLARRALGSRVVELADALLEPTRVYVPAARALWAADVPVHGMVHISGGGLLNLLRLAAPVGYVLDALPQPPAIFEVVRAAGDVPPAELHATFNMGIGLCVVVPGDAADAAIATMGEGTVIGRVVAGPDRRVELPAVGLIGRGDVFA